MRTLPTPRLVHLIHLALVVMTLVSFLLPWVHAIDIARLDPVFDSIPGHRLRGAGFLGTLLLAGVAVSFGERWLATRACGFHLLLLAFSLLMAGSHLVQTQAKWGLFVFVFSTCLLSAWHVLISPKPGKQP